MFANLFGKSKRKLVLSLEQLKYVHVCVCGGESACVFEGEREWECV